MEKDRIAIKQLIYNNSVKHHSSNSKEVLPSIFKSAFNEDYVTDYIE